MGQVSLTTEDFLLNASSGVDGRLGTWSNPHGTEVVEDKGIVRAVISFGEINKSLRLLEVEKRYHETSLASLAIETFGILLSSPQGRFKEPMKRPRPVKVGPYTVSMSYNRILES